MTGTAIDEAVVEDIVRFYYLAGGAAGSHLACLVLGMRRATSSHRDVLADIALVLAECPFRVVAGNPYREATITAVERAAIAEIAYNNACRLVGRLQDMQGTDVWPETREAQRDRDLWHRMEQRYRSHPSWPLAMVWLRNSFGRLVHGDPARGLRGDAAFLEYIQGA